MATNWTQRQLAAINAKDKLTVISAAAGSGKTTVLVERALQLLLDEQNPVSADRLLIVTFSNASAAEFRKRIEKGMAKRLRQDPSNSYIKMQKAALQKADISTIHAFCIKLVRENFHSLAIDADFSICDEAQSRALHSRAVDMAVNYGYTLKNFKELVSFYGKSSSDRQIKEFLRDMDYFFSALPHPLKAAEKMRKDYGSYGDISLSPAYALLQKQIRRQADYARYLHRRMDEIYSAADFEGYEEGIRQIGSFVERLKAQCAKKQPDLSLLSLPSLGRAKPSCRESEAVKAVYKELKATFEKIADMCVYLSPEKYEKSQKETQKYVDVLFEVFFEYQRLLMRDKKRRGMFEFSDFEHFALELLEDENGAPTPLCLALKEKYRYIMEDEFQDTSFVQDAIFAAIAKEEEKNLYVVGDIKQSIYGFRKASPEIFLEKRQRGISDSRKANTIFLPHNFRSDYGVIRGVNRIFSRIMSHECGGVDYTGSEKLQTLQPPCTKTGVVINIYEDKEAENTAAAIAHMIHSGYTIEENGKSRPVQPGDFCILMRNSKSFKEYKKAIEDLGIQTYVRDEGFILQKPEVDSVISLLRAINNPLQDVWITAAMLGDIFAFTPDEVLQMRADHPKAGIYKALSLSDNPKAANMLELLKDFSYVAGVYSADKLIDYICKKTGYYRTLSFSQDGGEKRENLRRFIDFAKTWAGGRQSDLPAFLRRIDIYLESGKTSSAPGEKPEGAVAIMTMHTSKGLEFPVCFVTGLAGKFNTMDSIKRLLLDTQLGVGMYQNEKFGYNSSTLNIRAIKAKMRSESADEEMRLLYVALTRSKNLLILSAAYNRSFTPNTLDKIMACRRDDIHPAALKNASCPIQWILYALHRHPRLARDYGYCAPSPRLAENIRINMLCQCPDLSAHSRVRDTQTAVQADMEAIRANLAYVYPRLPATKLPIKMSVSEITKTTPITLSKPDFVKEQKVSAAEKGTAMHRFAAHCDILTARVDLDSRIQAMADRGIINPRLLDKEALQTFLYSPIAAMILNSPAVYTEKEFLVPYPARRITGDSAYTADEILVQGVMDCILQNGDEITVIDYKTDYITNISQLVKRYSPQLEMYRYGAKQLFKTEKVKCILYSFCLGEYVEF